MNNIMRNGILIILIALASGIISVIVGWPFGLAMLLGGTFWMAWN